MRNEETIFAEALGKRSAGTQAAYLDQSCGDDSQLRREVEALLAAHRQAGGILEAPPSGFDVTRRSPMISDGVGSKIGPYTLLEQIGGGGMGVVYMAEQARPVRRKVALKIIKAGMDTRQVIARFEAERQALTMMDHPNIAKVLDAGTTEAGRPYFVMELVKGIPITDYCDEARLNTRQRLELLIQVCNAVQHAHQKGIIHRDLKPGNVLVTLHDDKPVPKVIDFGIAKAAGQVLTDKTLFTNYAQMLGTPLYMSPEQAQISGLDVDTRSDIYSLGVLMYELLTGTTPFDKQRLREAAYDEMRRIIREEDPPKPSTRLSTMGEKLTAVSAERHTDPRKLGQLVRGELDWIVMKALEKDRTRRYESANGLARDVQRHLRDEPVQACPPSAGYRFRKFARRNRTAMVAGLLLTVSAMVALSGIGWAVRDHAAREQNTTQERIARQARVGGQLEQILKAVAQFEKWERWNEALVSAQQAMPALAAGEAPPDIQERVRHALADLELVRQLERIRMWSGTPWAEVGTRQSLSVWVDPKYAAALRQAGIDIDALPVKQAVDRITSRREIAGALLPALYDWLAVRSAGKDYAAARRLSDVLQRADPDPWRQRIRDALARKDWLALKNLSRSADLDRQHPAVLMFLYASLPADGSLNSEGELLLRRAQCRYPSDFWISARLGINLIFHRSPDKVREGIGYMRVAVAIRPHEAWAINNLGIGFTHLGDYDQAIACYKKSLQLKPRFWEAYSNLANALDLKGLHDEAIATLEQAIKVVPCAAAYANLSMIHSSRPDANRRNLRRALDLATRAVELEPQVSNYWTALGIARCRQSQWQGARIALERSLELGSHSPGWPSRWEDAINWFFLAMCHQQLGQEQEARQCYEKGVAWMRENHRSTEELIRYRNEALGQGIRPKHEDAATYHATGNAYAQVGRWEKAAAAYGHAIELDPSDGFSWYRGAALHLAAGDTEGYRRACREMLARFGRTRTPVVAEWVAKTCSLAPGAVDDLDLDRVQRLAQLAVTGTEKDRSYPWYVLAKALSEYRAGRDAEAARWLDRYAPRVDAIIHGDASAFALRAMVQHHMGRTQEAASALGRAKAIIAAKMPNPAKGEVFGELDFQDWLHCQILCREAQTLLGTPDPGAHPAPATREGGS